MVNLTIEKITEPSGGTKFKLSPASFTLGAQDANTVDEIGLTLPEDWMDKTVRVYFMPAASAPFYVLWNGQPFKATANMTKRAGAVVVDAIGGDYHAYSTTANYRTYSHLTPQGDVEPVYTPSQIDQFLATAQRYMTLAQQAGDEARQAKAAAQSAQADAHTSAALAEEYRMQTSRLKEQTQTMADATSGYWKSAEERALTADTARRGADDAKNRAQAISDSMQSRLDGAIAQLVPPEITVKRQTTTEYVLQIKDKNGTYDTPNLKGRDGTGAGDMLMSVYDTDSDGVVDRAQYSAQAGHSAAADHATSADEATTLGGHSASHFATRQQISSLATVASTGSYADLSGKPTIPVVNNAKLTIQKNGSEVGNFTANASASKTINIQISKSDVGLSAVDNEKQMPIGGGTFTGVAIASEEERTTRSLFNEEVRQGSESGSLLAVKYFINVTG